VALTPSNPAQRAAEQQEVAMAVRAIQILGQAFPEEFRIYVDGKMTIKAFLEKMRVTLLKERPEAEVKQAIGQMAQLLARHGAPTGDPAQAQGLQ
jgi:hypothetical protein